MQGQDGVIPYILQPEASSKEQRKNWARLIQKIYDVDPLTCPKCRGRMRIISFIGEGEVIKKILKHLGLREVKPRPPPRAKLQPQNVQQVVPEAVRVVDPINGCLGASCPSLIPLLIEAIKEQQEIIERQSGLIKAQGGRIEIQLLEMNAIRDELDNLKKGL